MQRVDPASDLDPFGEAFLTDPFPFHEQLREAGPAVRLTRYGVWGVARYAEVSALLLDWETFCSSSGVGLADFRKEPPWRKPSIILEADPPLHTRTHKVLARVLSPSVLRALRPTFERVAEEMVDALVARGSFDGVNDLGRLYPTQVFADAIGLPRAGRENLLPYGNMVFNANGALNALFEKSVVDAKPVLEWIAKMTERRHLADGSIGAAVYAAVETGEIDEDEAAMLVRSLLTAGLDTTVHGIGSALVAFARHPAEWARLHADPALARNAFDEVMRYESPVQAFFRTTTRPTEIGGIAIDAGEKVLVFFAAANRDPRRWHDPDRFDITRRAGGHVAFGSGIHRCVGEFVGKMEGEIVLAALARRASTIELDGEPVLRLNNTLRGYDSAPLRVTAA
jgi:cytochrome P450